MKLPVKPHFYILAGFSSFEILPNVETTKPEVRQHIELLDQINPKHMRGSNRDSR